MSRALAALTVAVAGAPGLDGAVQALLSQLASALGFKHSTVFLVDDERDALVAISSHGYDTGGAGAEVKLGEGVLGVVVKTKRPVRFGGRTMEGRYGRTVRTEAARAGHAVAREIPPPCLSSSLSF